MNNENKRVIIIGSGLVGSLMGCFMAKRGYQVNVYEKREDYRNSKIVEGRSINLSMSNRARRSLKEVGLEEKALDCSIRMKGRLLHYTSGEIKSVPYDPITNQCLHSISRNRLNIILIEDLLKKKNVKLFFNHKLVDVNHIDGTVKLVNTDLNEEVEARGDLIIGADGAYSAVRRKIQNVALLNFSQKYIEHGYLELGINCEKGALMVPNHLHIWPRREFMMIALPNIDESWTVTLFMPFSKFESIKSKSDLITFFKSTFPDYFNFTDEELLCRQFLNKKPRPLVSVKCNPLNFKKVLLIGDAAHAMVPFYGQGMNAGFEDCLLLNDLLNLFGDDFDRCLVEFSQKRWKDAHAICDLAMYNYIEMRDLVVRPSYLIRRWTDNFLFKILPHVWVPLYNSVTFSEMTYNECRLNKQWQDQIINLIFNFIIITIVIISILCVYNFGNIIS